MPKLSPKPKKTVSKEKPTKSSTVAKKESKPKAKTTTKKTTKSEKKDTKPTANKSKPKSAIQKDKTTTTKAPVKAKAKTTKAPVKNKREKTAPKDLKKTTKNSKSQKEDIIEDEIDEEELEDQKKGIPMMAKIAALVISPLLCGLIFYFMTAGSGSDNTSRGADSAEEEDWGPSGVQTYKKLEDAPADGILFQEKRTGDIIDVQHLPQEYRVRYSKNPEFRKIR